MTDDGVGSSALLAPFFFFTIVLLRVLTLNVVGEYRDTLRSRVGKEINDRRTDVALTEESKWNAIIDWPLAIDFVPSRTRNAITLSEILLEVTQARRPLFLVERAVLLK